jgi:2-methylfumaryl-CoA isomerase
MNGTLKGLRIVECAAFVAVPLCGNVLAQLGAEVIRIDPIGGAPDIHRWPVSDDGHSLYWAGLNSAKRSVALDLKSEKGKAIARRLITAPGEGAGIFVTNATQPLFPIEELRRLRPDLISLTLQGYPDGEPAVDYTVNAETGLPYLTGPGTGDLPVNHSLPAWDIAAGLHAAIALLAAERQRRLSGRGTDLQLALSDVALWTLTTLGYSGEIEVAKQARPRLGNFVYGTFGKDFESADGKRLMLIPITTRQWQNLVRVAGLAEKLISLGQRLGLDLDDEGDRYRAREEIGALFEAWCHRHALADLAQLLSTAKVCWAPYRRPDEILSLFNRAGAGVFEKVRHPDFGPITVAGSPVRARNVERRSIGVPPRLGIDTRPILIEQLGLTPDEIERLSREGVIST